MVDFDRSVLGVESAPMRYDVEKGAIRKFVEAIGDADPIYRDEKVAQAAGFKTIVAPPTFLCTFRAQELPDLKMVFVFTDLTFTNQHGEVVAKGRNTGIMRE